MSGAARERPLEATALDQPAARVEHFAREDQLKALWAAAIFHGLHGAVATLLGLGGLAHMMTESHVSSGDAQFFGALIAIGSTLGVWTVLTARHAAGPRWRPWVLSRAVFAVVLLAVYVFIAIGAVGLASSGGMGAPFMVAVAFGVGWLAIPELAVVGGAITVIRNHRAPRP